jgi:hypothetical protein
MPIVVMLYVAIPSAIMLIVNRPTVTIPNATKMSGIVQSKVILSVVC